MTAKRIYSDGMCCKLNTQQKRLAPGYSSWTKGGLFCGRERKVGRNTRKMVKRVGNKGRQRHDPSNDFTNSAVSRNSHKEAGGLTS